MLPTPPKVLMVVMLFFCVSSKAPFAAAQATQQTDVTLLEEAVRFATDALGKPACRGLFRGADPVAMLREMIPGGHPSPQGVISFSRDPALTRSNYAAVTAPAGLSSGRARDGRELFLVVDIVINEEYWLNPPTPLTPSAERANTLIHELGHKFIFLPGPTHSDFEFERNPDGTEKPGVAARNSELERRCAN